MDTQDVVLCLAQFYIDQCRPYTLRLLHNEAPEEYR